MPVLILILHINGEYMYIYIFFLLISCFFFVVSLCREKWDDFSFSYYMVECFLLCYSFIFVSHDPVACDRNIEYLLC